jgi:DtxR family Mn-dependent transcriptional regulator
MLSSTEENYLKAIYKLAEKNKKRVSTNAIAAELSTKAASVTDMLKRLSEKNLLVYKKYKGVNLTEGGRDFAMKLIRKHRLWEVFLVDKLGFGWDEVHEIAEQLEHIQSEELTARLDAFLNHPRFDPHGDPIPNAQGVFTLRSQFMLSDLTPGEKGTLVGVKEQSNAFLQTLEQLGLEIGTEVKVEQFFEFDASQKVSIDGENTVILSPSINQNLLVSKIESK